MSLVLVSRYDGTVMNNEGVSTQTPLPGGGVGCVGCVGGVGSTNKTTPPWFDDVSAAILGDP